MRDRLRLVRTRAGPGAHHEGRDERDQDDGDHRLRHRVPPDVRSDALERAITQITQAGVHLSLRSHLLRHMGRIRGIRVTPADILDE